MHNILLNITQDNIPYKKLAGLIIPFDNTKNVYFFLKFNKKKTRKSISQKRSNYLYYANSYSYNVKIYL